MSIELIYFTNPMCSWCWGFSPVMQQLLETHGDTLNLSLITGSLGDRGRQPMAEQDKAYVREHWEHVHEASGQPFDFGFFERETFVYDTERPTRALALLRSAYPALAFPFLAHLQERFYRLNEDITDLSVLSSAAGRFGFEPDDFEARYNDPVLAEGVQEEWRQTSSLGVTGYPTLLAVKDQKPKVVTIGYQPFDAVESAVRSIAGLEPAVTG